MSAPSPADEDTLVDYCPVFHHTIEMVGRRWTGVVLMQVSTGPKNFGTIKGAIPGLSDRLLSERLKELEAEGAVERTRCGREVTYGLTERGCALLPILAAVMDYNERWSPDHAQPRSDR